MIPVEELKKYDVFKELNDEELIAVSEIGEKQHFEPQIRIFSEGNYATRIYFLIEGEVKIQLRAETDPEPITIETITPGHFFAWSALTEPYSLTATALSTKETVVGVWRADALRDLFENNPHIGYVFMKELCFTISSRYKHIRTKLLELRNSIIGAFK